MIEFIRRSLMQKVLEGEMRIIAAGLLSNGETKNFTVTEGKTTLTVISSVVTSLSGGSSYLSTVQAKAYQKGAGSFRIAACRTNTSGEGGSYFLNDKVTVTADSITTENTKVTDKTSYINYIIFEIDE